VVPRCSSHKAVSVRDGKSHREEMRGEEVNWPRDSYVVHVSEDRRGNGDLLLRSNDWSALRGER